MIRVLSYNVLSLRRGVRLVAGVVRATDPDVVCIQEAPRFLGGRRRCRELADACGLAVVTGGRSAAANLLLARRDLPVVACRDVKLPWHPPRHRRGVAAATFDVEGVEVVVASTHLSLDAAERLDQAARVLDLLADGPPAVLAGDINETPEGASWRLLASRLVDAYAAAPLGDGLTSHAERPYQRIDGVFVSPRLAVVECGVPDVPGLAAASDHLPVLARIAQKTVG